MAYEYLKKLFGTPKDGEEPKSMTYEELEAAIDGDKDIKLANLTEGQYVSKGRLDAKNTEVSGLQKQLEEANKQIASYKDMDIEAIKKSASDWEEKYNADTKALKDQMEAQERSHQEDMFFSGYQFTSKAAKNGVREEFDKKEFKLEDGKFLGADEFMQGLMKDDDYKGAFVQETAGESDTHDTKDTKGEPDQTAGTDNKTFPVFSGPSNTPGQNGAGKSGQMFNFDFTGVRKHDDERK